MVFTLFTWLLIGAGALLGLDVFNKLGNDEPAPLPPRRLIPARGIKHKIAPGDVIYVQNGSPYGYEPDGNLAP